MKLESNQKIAVQSAMNIIRDILSSAKRIKRELVSPEPTGDTKHVMMLIGNLLDSKRRDVGYIRIKVTVPVDGKDVIVRIEWTRHVFGFWYIREITLKDFVGSDEVDIIKLRRGFDPVKWTADGTTTLASMNRMFRKVRKNRERDRGYRAGLVG